MGENKHIEELDAFAKKYIKEIETEKLVEVSVISHITYCET